MFGKFLDTIKKPLSPKVRVNNNFLSVIQDIENTREKVDIYSRYEELINKAIILINRYCNNKDNHILVEAIDILVEATEVKQSKPEAYFYLASIAYTINDLDMAIKYLKYTVSINPNFPKLNLLRDSITNSLNIKEEV